MPTRSNLGKHPLSAFVTCPLYSLGLKVRITSAAYSTAKLAGELDLKNRPHNVARGTHKNISTQESQLFKSLSVCYNTILLRTLRRPGSTDLLSLNLNSSMPVI